jgi:hypothetical protein
MATKISDVNTLDYYINSGKIEITKTKTGWVKVVPLDKALGRVTVSATVRKEMKNMF